MQVIIRNRRWNLVFQNLGRAEHWGLCDPPDKPGKKITIDSGIRGQKRLEILLHEGVHACSWDLDEDAVAEISDDLSRMLWRLGYRCPEDQQEEKG